MQGIYWEPPYLCLHKTCTALSGEMYVKKRNFDYEIAERPALD